MLLQTPPAAISWLLLQIHGLHGSPVRLCGVPVNRYAAHAERLPSKHGTLAICGACKSATNCGSNTPFTSQAKPFRTAARKIASSSASA